MIFAKRLAVLFFTAAALLLLFHSRPRDYHSTVQGLSQSVGLGKYLQDEKDRTSQQEFAPLIALEAEHSNNISNNALTKSPYPPGTLKPNGQNYTRALITGRLTSENTTWLDEYHKSDPTLATYVYIVDDLTAPLHTPMNKGNEAMYYLTYILDHYDRLADINIFMHAHRFAWHNADIIGNDAVEVLKRLSVERVTREGYMNLRCHWDPGCPERLYPRHTYKDHTKPEEMPIARAWAEMFPNDPIPEAIGAPCCAQFALSKERILSIPKAKFEKYRDWLIRTSEDNWISGRVFEYLWQKIFADVPKLCPSARVCYCDGYGICFTTSEVYNQWHEEYHFWDRAIRELEKWEKQAAIVDDVGDWKKANVEEMELTIPMPGRKKELQQEIDRRHEILIRVREEAMKNGTDPEIRAMVAGREWRPGDGF